MRVLERSSLCICIQSHDAGARSHCRISVLARKLHLGLLLGGILIVGGLYIVLWGKGKELKKVTQLVPVEDEDKGIEIVVSARSGSSRWSCASGKDLEASERRDEARISQTLNWF